MNGNGYSSILVLCWRGLMEVRGGNGTLHIHGKQSNLQLLFFIKVDGTFQLALTGVHCYL